MVYYIFNWVCMKQTHSFYFTAIHTIIYFNLPNFKLNVTYVNILCMDVHSAWFEDIILKFVVILKLTKCDNLLIYKPDLELQLKDSHVESKHQLIYIHSSKKNTPANFPKNNIIWIVETLHSKYSNNFHNNIFYNYIATNIFNLKFCYRLLLWFHSRVVKFNLYQYYRLVFQQLHRFQRFIYRIIFIGIT